MLQGERHCHCHGAAGGNRGCPLGREKMWVTPELAALSCCCPLVLWCPLSPLRGLRTGSLPAPREGAQGSGAAMPRLHRPCQRHSPIFPSSVPHVHHHSSSPCSGIAQGCSPCSRVILQLYLSHGRLWKRSWAGDTAPGMNRTPGRDIPTLVWGFMDLAADSSVQHRAHPLSQGSSHPLNPNSNSFLHPQNTRLFSQKPQTLKGGSGGK